MTIYPYLHARHSDDKAPRAQGRGFSRQTAASDLKYDESDVRLPIVSVLRMAAACCVVHFEKKDSFVEFPHRGRKWLVT